MVITPNVNMPIEPVELVKLIGGIVLITIPGYLWSFLFAKKLTRPERLAFGFVFTWVTLTVAAFMLSVLFDIPITQTTILFLFILYTIPVLVLYGLSLYRFGRPKIDLTAIKNKKYILLLVILGFSFFMMFLPHLANTYYLPFHVDEWIHWSYTRGVIESGATAFLNPYTGSGTIINQEIGFHIATGCLNWLSGSTLLTIFLFMPAILAVFSSLIAFNIGERNDRKFGLEAAFLVAFIPTTVRFLGPSFYVAVTLGLLLLIFTIWLGQLKKFQGALFIAGFIWTMFIVHPPTALAGVVIMLIYAIFLAIEKEYTIAGLTTLFTILPLIIVYILTTRWDYAIEILMEAIHGQEILLTLPRIWVDFEHLGIVTWILFIIGVYFAFAKGKALVRTLSLSSIAFILIIGFYDRLGYGVPIIYERTFLYLALIVALIAALGLGELRTTIHDLAEKNIAKKYARLSKNLGYLAPLVVCLLLLTTAVPAHLDIPYYEMADETDYETFTWIRDNIDQYRDENHTYEKGAVHPFKASPFSAITGLYIVSSSMHPIYGYHLHKQMEQFLREQCGDTSFLDRYKISVIYGDCNNSNLTMIYEDVYLYPGLFEP